VAVGVAVGVGVDVLVGGAVGVLVGVGVRVGVGVGVGVGVEVGVGVSVGVLVGVGVGVGVRVAVGAWTAPLEPPDPVAGVAEGAGGVGVASLVASASPVSGLAWPAVLAAVGVGVALGSGSGVGVGDGVVANPSPAPELPGSTAAASVLPSLPPAIAGPSPAAIAATASTPRTSI
jgi:hypothetical protein